jgi:hypothetical protein
MMMLLKGAHDAVGRVPAYKAEVIRSTPYGKGIRISQCSGDLASTEEEQQLD